MVTLKVLWFQLLSYFTSIAIEIVCLPYLIGSRQRAFKVKVLVSRSVCQLMAWVLGIHMKIEGLENVPQGPCLLASKHQSAWETVALNAIIENMIMALKQQLMYLPFLYPYLSRMGMIPINRKQRNDSLKRLAKGASVAIQRGYKVLIFPEGTRTAVGEHVKYSAGVFMLYRQLGVPVVPIALNSGLLWGRRSLHVKSGTITIRFLPVIEPGLDRDSFMTLLTKQIETHSDILCKISDSSTHISML